MVNSLRNVRDFPVHLSQGARHFARARAALRSKEVIMGDSTYISKVAVALMGRLRITHEEAVDLDHRDRAGISAQKLYERRADDVRKELKRMNPETQGRIAIQGLADGSEEEPKRGRTSLYEVHCGSYLGKYKSGRDLLLDLATTAVIAEMTDQLRTDYQLRIQLDADEVRGTPGL